MRLNRMVGLGSVLAAMLVSAGCAAGAGESEEAARTIEIEMVDTAFRPESVSVAKGETVRFVFTNEGKLRHEAVIGSAQEQSEHAGEMKEDGGHGHGGGDDDEAKVTVDAGESEDLTYRFEKAGTYEIGCHEPGHYEAGMKVAVTVE